MRRKGYIYSGPVLFRDHCCAYRILGTLLVEPITNKAGHQRTRNGAWRLSPITAEEICSHNTSEDKSGQVVKFLGALARRRGTGVLTEGTGMGAKARHGMLEAPEEAERDGIG